MTARRPSARGSFGHHRTHCGNPNRDASHPLGTGRAENNAFTEAPARYRAPPRQSVAGRFQRGWRRAAARPLRARSRRRTPRACAGPADRRDHKRAPRPPPVRRLRVECQAPAPRSGQQAPAPGARSGGHEHLRARRGRRQRVRAKAKNPVCAAARACSTRCDLPEPVGPRIRIARGPTKTTEAWIVGAIPHTAGKRTMNRAPSTIGASPSNCASTLFSAQMRPPCASTICLEIDRPRPEFWPKP